MLLMYKAPFCMYSGYSAFSWLKKYTDKPAKATAANDATAIKAKNNCSAISLASNTCKL